MKAVWRRLTSRDHPLKQKRQQQHICHFTEFQFFTTITCFKAPSSFTKNCTYYLKLYFVEDTFVILEMKQV